MKLDARTSVNDAATTDVGKRKISLPVCQHVPARYEGPAREEVLKARQEHLVPGLLTLYQNPLMLVEGKGQYVWDETGRRYLDGYGGIVSVSVGHCHPKIVKRVQEQLGKLHHATTIYLHPAITAFATALAQKFPEPLKVAYFTNSGSEANDVATLLARECTGNLDVISLRNGYHGGTSAMMGLTAQSTWKFKTNTTINTKYATPGYCYRCPFGLTYPSCDLKCARDTKQLIEYETAGSVAAFIAEPIQGVGGVIVPPADYFKVVYEIVRKAGGMCIADEVQTGFGRTGEHFWGFENFGVVPDAVTMAKGIGNGFPLGAVMMRAEMAAVTRNKMHFNTFAGNPIAMTQGLATLEVIEEERLQANAKEVGGYLKQRLVELQERSPIIGDVRGMGLMIGVELVTNRKTKEPATRETAEVLERAKERQLLLGKGGLYNNVLRIKPPMCVTKADADFVAECLEECLEAG